MSAPPLSDRERATLAALCATIAPAAARHAPQLDLAAAVEARLAALDAAVAQRVAALLRLWDHPLAAVLSCGRAVRFGACAPAQRERWLKRWELSPLPAQRAAFQALRRLILSTAYGQRELQAAIGYLGPPGGRTPELAWEGPLEASPAAGGPIASIAPGAPRRFEPAAERGAPAGLVEGRALPAEMRLRAEVCVVGSGAGGAVVAARLAEAGFDVVVLEEGGYHAGGRLSERELDAFESLYADRGTRATDDLALPILQGRSVGGSTTINWLLMLRPREHVLEEWRHEHGTEGMDPASMAAVFARIEGETETAVVPDAAHSPNNRILLDGARRLGWRTHAARLNVSGCVRAGTCGTGCRYGARRGPSAVYLPRAFAAGARLYADVRVDRIELAERGGAAPLKRLHATVLDGASGAPRGRLQVEAPIVVLAGGAVGTPVLLQRSGLGGGGVGRFLRLHPTTGVAGDYDRLIHPATGVPLSAVCDEFVDAHDGYGFWIECPPAHPALLALSMPGFGEAHHELMCRFPRLGTSIVLVRDGADRGRSAGEVTVDRHGRVHIRYRLGRAERERLVEGMQAAVRLHFAAGAREVRTLHAHGCTIGSAAEIGRIAALPVGPNRLGMFSAHVNGTCRIGRHPRTSGCSPDGQRHGVPGLYVADGSLLPTAPGVNPQETIMAVASVIAARIAERHAHTADRSRVPHR